MQVTKITSRRDFLRLATLGAASAVVVAACGPAAAPTPTAAPKPAEPTKPAAEAPKPTAAPKAAAPTAAPTAAAKVEPTKPAAPAAKAGPVTLRVWAWNKADSEDQVKLYQQEYPSVKVEFEVFTPQDAFEDKLQTAYAANSAPDVHRMNDDSIPYYGKRGALLPLENDLPQVIKKEEVYWDAVESCKVYGHLQAIPVAIRTGCIYYNVDLFNKYGVPLPPKKYPDEAWTWAKFVEAATALRKDDVWGFNQADNYDWLFDNVKANGGGIMSKDCMKFGLTEPAAVEALQFWADMINVKKVAAPPPVVQALGGAGQMFMAGKSAMVAGSSIPNKGDLKFKWDIAGRPIVPGKTPVTFLAIQTWASPKSTKEPQEAIKMLAFFLGEKTQKLLATGGQVIPINRKVSETDYVKAFPNANMQIPLQSIPYGRTMPLVVGMQDVKDLARPQFQVIALGQKKAADAMKEVEAKANAALQKAGGC